MQLFAPVANTITRIVLGGVLLLLVGCPLTSYGLIRSAYFTRVDVAPPQPVQFSHRHHVDALGIDCRYCHTSVEESSFAGIPSTEICMTCHTQIWSDSPMLAPVRASYETGVPLRWTRVHDLPGFAYFDHSIHLAKGIGCDTCHGRVDQMALTYKQESLFMQWCLECHREPHKWIRPPSEVFNLAYQPPEDQVDLGVKLMDELDVRRTGLTNCTACHR